MLHLNEQRQGRIGFTREGAHSQPRILFYEDITGETDHTDSSESGTDRDNIEICRIYDHGRYHFQRQRLWRGDVMDEKNEVYPVRAPYVVLACGGLRRSLQKLHNFPHIAGDGLGIAMKHQVVLEHLDYIQIHPTTLILINQDAVS